MAEAIKLLEQEQQRLSLEEAEYESRLEQTKQKILSLTTKRLDLENQIPQNWMDARSRFEDLAAREKKARQKYRRNADDSYEVIATLQKMLADRETLISLQDKLPPIEKVILNDTADRAMARIKALGQEFDSVTNANPVTSRLSKARRALRGNNPDQEKALEELRVAIERLEQEISWRSRASRDLMPELQTYEQSIRNTIGMRLQERLTADQAESIATCLAVHKDISLYF